MRKRSSGLTLLEVLVALVVLVLAISTILPLFAVGSSSHKRGMDQAQMAWMAPRVAAKIQDRLYDSDPAPIKGYVHELQDGSILIDDAGKPGADGGAMYRFEATFTPISQGSNAIPPMCYHLHVELSTRIIGEPQIETYDTVVLRKLVR